MKLLISGKKMLMSAEFKGCVMSFFGSSLGEV